MTRPGGQGRQPALPPRPAGDGLDRLPEPVPAGHRRPHRRLLLQAAHRPRAPRQAQRGPRRPVAPASAARSPRRSRRTTGSWPARSPASTRDILGKDRFFLELQDHGIPEQRRLNEQLLRLAPEMGLPLVVTNDLHYVHREQHEAHDVAAVRGHRDQPRHAQPDALRDATTSTSRPRPRWRRCSRTSREALRNTRRIAEMVDLKLPLRRRCGIPHFPVPDGDDGRDAGCARSARRASSAATARSRRRSRQRLDYELGVIISMGYAGYFLIVADFVRFAREQGIATTCRGSRAGLDRDLHPGHHAGRPASTTSCPFERFLNPDRVTMPDIDVDFEDERRDEVIDYVSRKYGQDHVAQIITFGTMLARAAIRDVGRVLGMGYGEVDRIAKAVPNQLGIKLDGGARDRARSSRRCTTRDPQVAQADRPRAAAGGRRAQRLHPRRGRGHQPRAADGADAAPEGDQLRRAHDPVRDARRRGAGPAQVRLPGPVQPDHPAPGRRPHPRAPRRSTHRPRPHPARRREDVRAAGLGRDDGRVPARVRGHAPLRPGAAADVGLRPRGHGGALPARARWTTSRPTSGASTARRRSTYLHPLLEPFLEKTYGIFVYQEDIMAAAIALGGFTGPEADTLGYAIRKKKSSVLRAQKDKFVDPGRGAGRRSRGPSTRCSRPSSRSSATASTRPTPPATASSPTRPRTSRRTTRSST